MTNHEDFDADVAVIGYGPSGVSAANFLGARGIRTLVFERDADIYQRARAVTVNDWTMRCYQSVGLDAALKAVMDETLAIRWMSYGEGELDRVVFPPSKLGHAPSYAIYQPSMEKILRDGAARFADHVEIRDATEVTGIEQDSDGATLTIRESGNGASRQVRARYVLACDGGSSPTRERLGIGLVGETVEVQWVVIDARVKRWWPNCGIVTFWTDKHRPVNDIPLAMGNHRWEFPLEAHESPADFSTHEQLWRLLETMGITSEDVEIHQHAFYRHHVRQAERWRDGCVMLVGDAAHLMPPWIGQGLQSGVRDAHNICWKLAEVISGRLPDAVLDSYEAERAPDVGRFTQMSVSLGRIVQRQLSEAELAAMRTSDGSGSRQPMPMTPWLEAGWLTGKVRSTNPVGKFIPQPRVAGANAKISRLDDLVGSGFLLLGENVDPLAFLDKDARSGWDELGATYRAIRSTDSHARAASDIIDLDGTLVEWMRGYGAKVIAVRPDFFVAASDVTGLSVPGVDVREAYRGQTATTPV